MFSTCSDKPANKNICIYGNVYMSLRVQTNLQIKIFAYMEMFTCSLRVQTNLQIKIFAYMEMFTCLSENVGNM